MRETLYRGLPADVKIALRSRLHPFDANEKVVARNFHLLLLSFNTKFMEVSYNGGCSPLLKP